MFILNRDIRFILLDSVLYDCFQASNPGFFLSLRDSFNFSVASELNEIASHFLAEAPNIDVAAAKRLVRRSDCEQPHAVHNSMVVSSSQQHLDITVFCGEYLQDEWSTV